MKNNTEVHLEVGGGAVERGVRTYVEQLQIVFAQRGCGLDPLVRLDFVTHHVGESRSSIYRHISAGHFAKPMKRGDASFWRFSDVERYRMRFSENYTESGVAAAVTNKL